MDVYIFTLRQPLENANQNLFLLFRTKHFPLPEERSVVRQALPQICAICVKNILLLGFGMTLGFPTILIPGVSGKVPGEKILMGQEAISWISKYSSSCNTRI